MARENEARTGAGIPEAPLAYGSHHESVRLPLEPGVGSESGTAPAGLIDPFGRAIRYLRLSVTDRCDFRCVYCMNEDTQFLPKADILTHEELFRLAVAFVRLGTTKLRLTGGEPLTRRGVMTLIAALGGLLEKGTSGLEELTLTTNGSQLRRYAEQLRVAGVRRINVSLDSLRPEVFEDITRWGRFSQVMDGLDAAVEAGLAVKINVVALRGVNEDEFPHIIDWCYERGFDLTFIEVMPMGAEFQDPTRQTQYLPLQEVRESLDRRYGLLASERRTGGPARYVRLQNRDQELGFITPLSHQFCESCNRVRITCTGRLYLCLGQADHVDLHEVVRDGNDQDLETAIRAGIALKPRGHDFIIDRERGVGGRMARGMSHTGG